MNEKQTKTINIPQSISDVDLSLFTSICLNESGQMDLRKFPDEKISEYYKNKSNTRSIIDLSGAGNGLIIVIINFIFYCFYYKPIITHTSWENIDLVYIKTLRFEIDMIKRAGTLKNYIDSKDDSFLYKLPNKAFFNLLKDFDIQYNDVDNWYKKPIWNLRDPHFHISEERINPSSPVVTLSFSSIQNPVNCHYAMEYIDFLLSKSTLAVSTIRSILHTITKFCRFLGDKNITDVNQETLDKFFIDYRENGLRGKKPKESSVAGVYGCLAGYYEFLVFKKYINQTPFTNYEYKPKHRWTPKDNSVNEYVIDQIYSILPEIPVIHALIFLIDDCTGLRISDICRLKKNRLLSKVGDRCFMNYYNTKEKHSVSTEIPAELHYLLTIYIKTQSESGSEYLFSNTYNGPYLSNCFSEEFNKYMEMFGVRTQSGEPYHYASHGLRHSQATDLEKRGASIFTIAKRLNDTLDVAMGYADYRNNDKSKDMSDFVKTLENEIPSYIIPVETDSETVDYLRKTMNGRALPHGSCRRPASLGECSHDPNFCLECEKFVTCTKYLNTHKEHLERLNEALSIAESTGNIKRAEKIKRSIADMNKTINALEDK